MLQDHDLKEPWLARKLGVSPQIINQWLKLDNPTTPRDPEVWDKMLDAFPKPVLGTPMIPVTFKTIKLPFAGNVPAGEWGDPLASEDFVELDNAQFDHPRRFACNVIGDSCYPALQQGDLTIWQADSAPPYRSIVIAQRKGDHGCTVKELLYDEDRSRVILHPINEKYDEPTDGDGWGVIARLVGLVRDRDGVRTTLYRSQGLGKKHF